MVRVKDNPSPVVCYQGNPAYAVVRFRGQHVRLISKVGAAGEGLVQEAVAAVEHLQQFQSSEVDVCLRDVIQNSDQETVHFKFDVLYEQSRKDESRREAKKCSSCLEDVFNKPSDTGTLRTCEVRSVAVRMGNMYDPLAPMYYGYSK